jgi:uncharacterized protein YqhQ
VILLAIVVFTLVGRPSWPWLVGSRIFGIPLIAGMSYELLRWSGTHSSERVAAILAAPGMWLQRLTTGVPEEPMIEVAVASLLSALDDEQVAEVIARGSVPETSVRARAR